MLLTLFWRETPDSLLLVLTTIELPTELVGPGDWLVGTVSCLFKAAMFLSTGGAVAIGLRPRAIEPDFSCGLFLRVPTFEHGGH